jgi:subtilase family serine protease
MNGAINDLSDSSSTMENILDVSTIGSCCQSTIVLCVFPNDTYFSDAFTAMLQGINGLTPTIISVSWGMPEIQTDIADMKKTNLILQTANINVCVASGDLGSTDGTFNLTPDFPSSSPYVTAVGGTRLICPNKVYDAKTKETVWNNYDSASGGGISTIFKKPSYQSAIAGRNRMIPDISFNSDPVSGITMPFNGLYEIGVGGTSFAAPFFAAFIALSGFNGFINPMLYSNNCFHDITSGHNSIMNFKGYSATKGFDKCTGLGSMDCSKFIMDPHIILPPSIRITIGQSLQVPIQSNLSVSWKSSSKHTSVMNGVIKGMRIGTSIITAYSNLLTTTILVIVQPVQPKKRKPKVKMIQMIKIKW